MIRLISVNPDYSIDPASVDRVKHPFLEFIPCERCEVMVGPPVMIEIPGHQLSELAPGVLAHVEELVGCKLAADNVED